MVMIWFFILFLSVYQMAMTDYFLINQDYFQLDAYTWETEEFRKLQLGEYLASQEELDYDRIASLMIGHHYDLCELKKEEADAWAASKALLLHKKPVEYKKLKNAYQMILDDIACFPVPVSTKEGTAFVSYEDGFFEPRTYGGERQHEGCDIFGGDAPRGFYPVLSMTGGTIENVGWLEKGGWRIGIRAPSGAYFYYAHLYQYEEEWKTGDKVVPGTLLGYMGDSGYGVQEGTVGNFDVHLHLGIYIPTDHYEELSVNPYWVLRYSERFIRQADY